MSAYDDWRRIENAHIRKALTDFKSGDEMSEPKLPKGMDDPVVAARKVSEADEYPVVRDALFARDAQWASALAASEARYSEAVEFISTCEDYFDQRADADAVGDPMHYQGNVEMHRLAECRRILSRPEARAVLEGGSRGEDA